MKAKKIDHVGIVVKDLDAALATYSRHFGFPVDRSRGGEVPALGIKNAFMPVGDSDLEFIQATSDQGPVAKFAEDRGEGHVHAVDRGRRRDRRRRAPARARRSRGRSRPTASPSSP